MQNYITELQALANPSFDAIQRIAKRELSKFSEKQKDLLWEQLERGVALLDTHEHLCQYLYSFGNMHQAKLQDAFQRLPADAYLDGFEVVDWGCGQGLGTINLFDFLINRNIPLKVNKVTLIEPSEKALERAELHVKAYLKDEIQIETYPSFFENIDIDAIKSKKGYPVIHIFSNILDIKAIDLKQLANTIDKAIVSDNYVVSVGPKNPTNHRIDAFYNYFDVPLIYHQDLSYFIKNNWTYKCKLYKLQASSGTNLIPIVYYPTVQFNAAYELDAYKLARKNTQNNFFDTFSNFEVAAPFDIGASVYDDVHPILAVLNNLITRGLPTKSSLLLEETFKNNFNNTTATLDLGEISYTSNKDIAFDRITTKISECLREKTVVEDVSQTELQELLTPIAVARFQKVLLEAIITGHLSLENKEWNILVEEKDVPFAALAFKDFSELFYHLTQLSDEYQTLKFPKICLDIIGSEQFKDSPLHLKEQVYTAPKAIHFSKEYDLVVDMAILDTSNITLESFSRFKCKNNCYFNIRSVLEAKNSRTVYTSSLIKYKKIVERTIQGEYVEITNVSKHLKYFLQLLFRKTDFRPGQIPILDRALRNLPVIGLLPTGGGKSLTYQIPALLQPGITLVIDPLKSLMKDQYDGLLNNGIDYCTYLNSSLDKHEMKHRETQMESSQMLFVFISPERLSILNFRERLLEMHEYNVYFSYGVIDEVHCVSEWGHDFRFSYLHLGRNLYNYVRAKEGEVSLIGLTATASFDALADVERELSGNGAFVLDAETTVRYENTNRLELQYKIEKVPVEFDIDPNYDKGGKIDSRFGKAIKVGNKAGTYLSKQEFLKNYIQVIPEYINELQKVDNVNQLKSKFNERQNLNSPIEQDLKVNVSSNYLSKSNDYTQAGIIFCPHVVNTGISVDANKQNLAKICNDVGSFSGKDDDNTSMDNLELFRNNKIPLMVATKAFGMGIDKPNVRFTINMNYSSSLESFVQEAGRAGRDRKMALSVILFADYDISKITYNCPNKKFPIDIIRNRWFHSKDLREIIDHYSLEISDDFIERVYPAKDMVKLFCRKDNRMFAFNECSTECDAFKLCELRQVPNELRDWHTETELTGKLQQLNSRLTKKDFRYFSTDYDTVIHFYNSNFKGDSIEKRFMHNLLSVSEVEVEQITSSPENTLIVRRERENGFLPSLLKAGREGTVVVYVPYNSENSSDIAKAIYRMCCIELIEDFTQDYSKSEYRIIARKKHEGGYFDGLYRFLLRYYTNERAEIEIEKAKNFPIKVISEISSITEVHRCLAYLTEFVYDKISEKRKRAIDDMRNFCIEGINESKTWIERNEDLKDYIYYYFNSKYAKSDYIAENGEAYSLTVDTENGKKADLAIIFKYLKIIEDDMLGVSTPIDNVKHLQGAVRLLKRSLTDTNPAISLLNAFTLVFLGTKGNLNLEIELANDYKEGMLEIAKRMNLHSSFWEFFSKYNDIIKEFSDKASQEKRTNEVKILVHGDKLRQLVVKYTE